MTAASSPRASEEAADRTCSRSENSIAFKREGSTEMKVEWVKRWRMNVSKMPVLPGVYVRQEGGFVVRGYVADPRRIDPKTKKAPIKEVLLTLPDEADPRRALAALEQAKDKIRGALEETKSIPTFKRYSLSLLERKVATRKIASNTGKEKWVLALKNHLWPAFGDFYVDQITHGVIAQWQLQVAEKMRKGIELVRVYKLKNGTKKTTKRTVHYSPDTTNGWLAILRVITAAMTIEYDLPRDPCDGIENFDTSTHRTYTREQPNSLDPRKEEVARFLDKMLELFPQHYAMTLLSFVLGHRPSTLRPLRRSGPSRDFIPEEGLLLVRRSYTIGADAMDATKTKKDQDIALPSEVVAVLQWHVNTQLRTDEQRRSELLFPSEAGGFRSSSCLQDPFRKVAAAIGLTKHITPKAGRRTFQDLTRQAAIDHAVKKSISGHATDAMVVRYSTPRDDEQREAIGKVVDIATARKKPA